MNFKKELVVKQKSTNYEFKLRCCFDELSDPVVRSVKFIERRQGYQNYKLRNLLINSIILYNFD